MTGKNGHARGGNAGVTELPYRTTAGAPPGAEILDFPGLLARAHSHGVDPYAPKRPAFHELITVHSGTLRTYLDFTEYELTPGSWIWVRPGQIQQYGSPLSGAEGTIVLFTPGFLSPATVEAARIDQPARQTGVIATDADAPALRRALDNLENEYRQLSGLPLEVHIEVIRHLLSVLVLRLARPGGVHDDSVTGDGPFRRFQMAVERDFARTHRVDDYAKKLGYSVRTLTRATRAATGGGAKSFIDDRVMLEAQRMLVHTSLSVAAIGGQLGFPDATVFAKFFQHRADEPPAAFRARTRSGRVHHVE